MKKIRSQYPDEFIDKLTEDFLSGGMALGKKDRIRNEIKKIREKNHDAIFLEMYFAVRNILLEDAFTALRMSHEAMQNDELIIDLYEADASLADKMLAYHEGKTSLIAQLGGKGRAAKYDEDKAETIRLYEAGKVAGKWETGRHHVPDAALEITPQIVAFSRGKGNLVATTTMPKSWIKEHLKRCESSPS